MVLAGDQSGRVNAPVGSWARLLARCSLYLLPDTCIPCEGDAGMIQGSFITETPSGGAGPRRRDLLGSLAVWQYYAALVGGHWRLATHGLLS